MADEPKKPPGFNKFQRIVRAVCNVPKADVDAALAADKKARMKAKRAKKKG